MVVQKKRDLLYLFIAITVIIVANAASSSVFTRIDFTKEKRFTVSAISKNVLSEISEPVKITVYLEGEFPSAFKRLRNATKDLLVDLKAYSGNIQYEFIDPISERSEQEKEILFNELYSKGLEPTELSVKTENGIAQKIIFPVALISYQDREIPVRLLQNRMGLSPDEVLNNSIQNLEYSFISAVKKITSGGKPRVGFTEGHGELTDLQLQGAMKVLSDSYEVGRIDLNQITQAGLEKLKLLIIPKPSSPFSELEKFKIDQFLMNGGKIFWAIDQVNAELDSMKRGSGEQLAFQKDLNLDDQLFKYGIRINYDLIGDMNCLQIPLNVGEVGGQGQMQMVPWLFYPIIMPVSSHPLVKNLDGIKTEFISTIDTIVTSGLRKEILLTTSPFNRTLNVPTLISLDMVEQTPDPQEFQSVPKAVSVLVEGKFTSVFKNRALPVNISSGSFKESSDFTKMIIFSDGDILKNQVGQDGSVYPLGEDRYSRQSFGNKTFLLNIADFLTNDGNLIQLRSKEIKLRLLDKGRLKAEKTIWQLINTVIPIIVIIILGIFQHFYRKRKYAV